MFPYPQQTELLIYLYNQRTVNEPEILKQLTAIFAGNRELAERVIRYLYHGGLVGKKTPSAFGQGLLEELG
ncbi:hypothetical protein [Carboxydocella sp. JDF658]|uniref:hypothetical protein n=1 Tax=Carboxydocella sp. JDF658 TaxID=1926600 RepID=UPI0009ABFB9C|nr:hypothetical protein [Carboxydocella sp. JDF658]GAW32191.1 hypothetical protein JDF658_19560 [Carboxydocella sp. JDF658]